MKVLETWKTWKDIFNYKTNCPICKRELYYHGCSFDDELTIVVYSNLTIKIALRHNFIKDIIIIEKRNYSTTYSLTGAATFVASPTPFNDYKIVNDILSFTQSVQCAHCSRYSYLIDIHISLKKKMLLDAFLKKEIICNKNMNASIINYYTHPETVYITNYLNKGKSGTMSLPLIPFNFNNLESNFQKIEKLLAFS